MAAKDRQFEFQSYNSSIKTPFNQLAGMLYAEFQSYNSSIKTEYKAGTLGKSKIFQSYNSSIKTSKCKYQYSQGAHISILQ